MKHFWTEETVARNADAASVSSHDWLIAKQRELEADTGVRWSIVHQHAGYGFHPIDTGIMAMDAVGRDTMQKIRLAYTRAEKDFTGYVSYLQIQEETHWDLKGLMAAVKCLERLGIARRTVDRMGKPFAFKLV